MKKFLIAILFFNFTFTGCDFLTTREAEKPETARSSFLPATTTEQLFKNFTESFREKIVRNYESCFVDSSFLNKKYKFFPAPTAVSKYNVLQNWNLESEKQYFTNLIANINNDKTVIVNLFGKNSSIQGDSAIFSFDYSIVLPNDNESLNNEYRGSSQFKINLDANNHWVITEWIDISTDNYPSWSELKGTFY